MFVKTQKVDGVAVLTIDRPDTLNAMNYSMLIEFRAIIEQMEADDSVRVLIVTGTGKAFIAGADIGHMKDLSPGQAKSWSELGQSTVGRLESIRKPVIAAVNGYALGGGTELALACDIRIASDKAVFGQPEVKLGMIAGFGGTQRLARLIGPGLAKEMLLTGDHYDAEAALRMGLVNKVVPADQLMDYCLELAKKIASRGTEGVRLSKQAVNEGLDRTLEAGLKLETELYSAVFTCGEPCEGCGAFMEKREPKWTSS